MRSPTATATSRPPLEAELAAVRLDLGELLATSDVVSLNCPYSPETHHLIDDRALGLMQSSAFLINTARGPIVDEAALVVRCGLGHCRGRARRLRTRAAARPRPGGLENAVLLPHLGSATMETRAAMATFAARNAVDVLTGQPPLTPIS